jgi:phosphomannomutase
VGESLTPGLLTDFALAFGTYINQGTVAVGRDTRPSGPMVREALIGGLLATGCDVVDVGIVPVPTLQIAVKQQRYDAGIAITASHNPQEWNALKFIRSDGVFLYPYQAEELLNVYHQGEFKYADTRGLGSVRRDEGAVERHIERLLALVDARAIARANFHVVVDCCNGAGAVVSEKLLRRIGVKRLTMINNVPDGLFAHTPEPIGANLEQLRRAVIECRADIGFAQDPDADRLAVCPETGSAISEEFTLALAADAVASQRRAPLVANLSTSRMIDEVGERYGCPVYRSPVGEINVVEEMRARAAQWQRADPDAGPDCVMGGEGNGGVIDPRSHYCRDSLRGMCLILEGLAHRGGTVSEWMGQTFRPQHMRKEKVECDASSVQTALLALRDAYASARNIDDRDGLKVVRADGSWLHVRASNTEPIMRIIAEADDEPSAQALCDRARKVVEKALRRRR